MQELTQKWLMDPTIGKIVAASVGLILIYALSRFLQRTTGRYIEEVDTRYRVRKFVGVLGYVAAFLLVAGIFSDRFGQLTVAFGVAGAGIAFALQEVIASVAGWVAISFGGFYKPGDRVQLGGIRGDVIDIGVLRTTLMECGQWVNADLYNGRIVRIANSFVFKEPVFNYSADFPFLWDEVAVPIRYGSDYRLAREILQRIGNEIAGAYTDSARAIWKRMIDKYLIEAAPVDPIVSLVANDNWVEFTLRYVVDYKLRRVTKDQLYSRIVEEIEATGERVRLASATFELVKWPPLEARLKDRREQR